MVDACFAHVHIARASENEMWLRLESTTVHNCSRVKHGGQTCKAVSIAVRR